MSNLETEFASQRFSPRMARSTSHACAVEHFKPAHESHIGHALRWIVCLAASVAIGAMCAGWRPL